MWGVPYAQVNQDFTRILTIIFFVPIFNDLTFYLQVLDQGSMMDLSVNEEVVEPNEETSKCTIS